MINKSKRTEKDLKQLAEDIFNGKVLGSWQFGEGQEQLIPLVFLVLTLGAELPENIAHVFEYLDKAGPRAVNGYPTFFSCQILLEEELSIIQKNIEVLKRLKKEYQMAGKGEKIGKKS